VEVTRRGVVDADFSLVTASFDNSHESGNAPDSFDAYWALGVSGGRLCGASRVVHLDFVDTTRVRFESCNDTVPLLISECTSPDCGLCSIEQCSPRRCEERNDIDAPRAHIRLCKLDRNARLVGIDGSWLN